MASRFGSRSLVERMHAARILAETQMGIFESEGEGYEETAITEQILSMAYPLARFVKFNQAEEGWTGADWIWWWIDETTGEAFGAVIQAKRLKLKASKWWIDFGYKANRQRSDLMFLGNNFEVVPIYALYLGTSNYRRGAFCRDRAHHEGCELCRKSTLSVVPGSLTGFGGSEFAQTEIALSYHTSLEELVDPDVDPSVYWSADFAGATDEFVAFLNEPQAGSRQIARKIVDQIRTARMGMFSAVDEAVATIKSEAIFTELPDDQGHWSTPYFPTCWPACERPHRNTFDNFWKTERCPKIFKGTSRVWL